MGLSEHSGVPRIPEGTLRSTGHDGGTGVLKHNWQLIGDGGSYCFTISIIPTYLRHDQRHSKSLEFGPIHDPT